MPDLVLMVTDYERCCTGISVLTPAHTGTIDD